jgi:hypothetical protein
VRFYQASSSETYGRVAESPQTESTGFNPRSPYAIAKVFAHFMTVDYREAHLMAPHPPFLTRPAPACWPTVEIHGPLIHRPGRRVRRRGT